MEPSAPTALPAPPLVAESLFGDRLPAAQHYAYLLATTGVDHGLVGPREVPILWDRHILNCAVLGEVIAPDARVADVGSGAGLPGLVLAVLRPDLNLVLVEPLQRRVTWLENAIHELRLPNVQVHRARAQQVVGLEADVVCSRAVARLSKLLGWNLPLLRPGGQILALKGASAQEELDEASAQLRRARVVSSEVLRCGVGVVDPPATVIRVVTAG